MTGKITYDSKGNALSFTGSVVDIYQAAALRAGIRLMSVGIKPHRSWTSMTAALRMATHYTGRTYKRGEHEQARKDLGIWIEIMKAAADKETRR